jgi:hypothetical protein
MKYEVKGTVIVTKSDGETEYNFSAPTIDMAIEKLGQLERSIVLDTADAESNEEYRATHSSCCDALLTNDICGECKEHAGPQKDD